MSTTSESENTDLELQLLPAWAKESSQTNRYANFAGGGEDRDPRGRGDRSGRPPRRDGGGRPPFGGDRSRGPRRDSRDAGPGRGGPRGERGPGPRGGRPGDRRGDRPPEPTIVLPKLKVEVLPEEKGVESITRQIKLTGRAFPLFEIAGLVVKRPERYDVQVSVVKEADGSVAQALFTCNLDQTLWLSENEAISHVLGRHFDLFYQAEKTPCDAPKGIFTFVAQCGMSGVVLGPPNYHDYQNKLRKLHAERFSRLPFEAYKARVKIVRDEAVVKQWLEEQSFKTEYICLNVPDAPKLPNREEVEKHFRATHAANVIRQVETHTLSGAAIGGIRNPGLRAVIRRAVDEQQRFPMKVATVLSQKFASAGLQFFKVNKTIVHVSVARPHYLDLEATPVSDGIRRIIEHLNGHPKCTRKQLFDSLAPSPAAPAPAPAPAEGAAPAAPAPTPEQAALASDLHWLVHQGHVIEFARGQIETAKKPAPRIEKSALGGYLPSFLVVPLLVGA